MNRRIAAFVVFVILVCFSVYSQSGVVTPDRRFVDNSDGTVTDMLLGIMWMKSPSGMKYNWWEATKYVDAMSFAGYDDWRLSYRAELLAMIQNRAADNASLLNALGFTNVQPSEYWSGSWFAYLGLEYGWVVDLRFGGTHSVIQDLSTFIWPVRPAE